MPKAPGQAVLPNSAPDSVTPKCLNLVRGPEQRLLEGALGAELVEVGGVETVEVGGAVEVEWIDEADELEVPGKHWK